AKIDAGRIRTERKKSVRKITVFGSFLPYGSMGGVLTYNLLGKIGKKTLFSYRWVFRQIFRKT
ncbi:MAG: hypothetical protein IIU15_03390, partial [Treponema sp.]|nr:hypothetical protein [Treponema sp.]